MRLLIGIGLLVAFSASLTMAGFAAYNLLRHRALPATAWAVLCVVVFVGQCAAGTYAARSQAPVSAGAPVTLASPAAASPRRPAPATSPSPVAADPCSAPSAALSIELPVADFGRIAVDAATCHVFVSSPASNEVVVLDYGGRVVGTIADEYGAGALAVGGSTLYVALTGTGSIDEVDTRALTRTKTLAAGLVKPNDLVLAGHRLWTTTGECGNFDVQLASVDVTSGAVATFKLGGSSALSYCMAFASDYGAGRIVAWDPGLEPADVATIDVSGAVPSVVQSQHEVQLGFVRDIALTPAGDRFVTAAGAPYEFDEWNVRDLQQDGVIYPGAAYPTAVAATPAGSGLVAVGISRSNGPPVEVYAVGRPAAIAEMASTGSDADLLYPRGLAFSGDGREVFAVTGAAPGAASSVWLNLLPIPQG